MNSMHFSPADAMRQQQEDRQRVASIKATEEKQLRKNQADALRHIAETTQALLPPIKKQADAAQEKAEAAVKEVEIVRRIADASEIQAHLALKKAKKADVKGILALIFSALALLIDVIVNRREIIEFFRQLFGI